MCECSTSLTSDFCAGLNVPRVRVAIPAVPPIVPPGRGKFHRVELIPLLGSAPAGTGFVRWPRQKTFV